MTTTAKERELVIQRLMSLGITYDDAAALRRISMTLHRWYELECGDGNDYGSWAIERDDEGDGKPYMVHHHYLHGKGKDYTTRTLIPDREGVAKKRLQKIMSRYPNLVAYVQTDPRGVALYILTKQDVEGVDIDSVYNRGIAVY